MKAVVIHIITTLFVVTAGAGWAQPPLTGAVETNTPMEPDTVTVSVLGSHEDSRFDPAWVEIRPGDVVRFEVMQGVHTVTAYHPDNRRNLGIPEGADSFDSGVLTAGDVWFLKISTEGRYNYFCLPHERMGHTGTIVASAAKNPATAGKQY